MKKYDFQFMKKLLCSYFSVITEKKIQRPEPREKVLSSNIFRQQNQGLK